LITPAEKSTSQLVDFFDTGAGESFLLLLFAALGAFCCLANLRAVGRRVLGVLAVGRRVLEVSAVARPPELRARSCGLRSFTASDTELLAGGGR